MADFPAARPQDPGFLQSLLANPESSQFLVRLGSQLLQPIQPGSNAVGHFGSALSGSLDFLEAMKRRQAVEALQRGQLGVQKENVRLREKDITSADAARQAQLGLSKERLGLEEKKLTADLARYANADAREQKKLELDEMTSNALAKYNEARAKMSDYELQNYSSIARQDLAQKMAIAMAPFLIDSDPEYASNVLASIKTTVDGVIPSTTAAKGGASTEPTTSLKPPAPIEQLPNKPNRQGLIDAPVGSWFRLDSETAIYKRGQPADYIRWPK